jgi:very-short-patch-repair endonuclease
VSQYEVRDDLGWLIARVDLAYPELKVAVEYDGHDHTTDDRRGRDIDRIDRLQRAGWVVVVVTGRQLGSPRRLVERVREALAAQATRTR